VQPFLDMVVQVYRNLHMSVNKVFGPEGLRLAQAAERSKEANNKRQGDAQQVLVVAAVPLLGCMESFKFLTECPIIVMLMFQLYQHYVQTHIPELVPLMVAALALEPPNMSPLLMSRFKELLAAQIKTLSFLTYLLKGFGELMRQFQTALSVSVMSLLRRLPQDAAVLRKELLIATRHIFATDFRLGFLPYLEDLLQEETLLGPSRSRNDPLKPLAYATQVDLLENVRGSLGLKQIAQVIHIATRNLHDPALPMGLKANSVKLLLNLVDSLYHNEDNEHPQRGKFLLLRILKAFVDKFGTLRHYIPLVEEAEKLRAVHEKAKVDSTSRQLEHALAAAASMPRPATTAGGSSGSSDAMDIQDDSDTGGAEGRRRLSSFAVDAAALVRQESVDSMMQAQLSQQAASGSSGGSGSSSSGAPATPYTRVASARPKLHELGGPPVITDTVREVRNLMTSIIRGLKTVLYCSSTYRRSTAKSSSSSSRHSRQHAADADHDGEFIMTAEERELVGKLFKWGLPCLRVFTQPCPSDTAYIAQQVAAAADGTLNAKQLKNVGLPLGATEMLEVFASAFTVLQAYNFRTTVGLHVPSLFEAMLDNKVLTVIPHFLVGHPASTTFMCDALLSFLVCQFDDVAGWNVATNSSGIASAHSIAKQASSGNSGRRGSGNTLRRSSSTTASSGRSSSSSSVNSSISSSVDSVSSSKKLTSRAVWINKQKEIQDEFDLQHSSGTSSSSSSGGSAADKQRDAEATAAAELIEERDRVVTRSIALRELFKMVFGSLGVFRETNEKIIRPHLRNIVSNSNSKPLSI
jgi:hypothetical protein